MSSCSDYTELYDSLCILFNQDRVILYKENNATAPQIQYQVIRNARSAAPQA